jgi:hypothetical protein
MRGLVLVALVGLAACDPLDVCEGQAGTCWSLTVEGGDAIGEVDQLRLDVWGDFDPLAQYTPETPERRSLPLSVALLFPPSAAGEIRIGVTAFLEGRVVGSADSVPLVLESGGRRVISLGLSPHVGSDAGAGDDLASDASTALPGCPAVFLIADQSGSMSSPVHPGATDSRYAAMKAAIAHVTAKYGAEVAFGLSSFGHDTPPNQCRVGVRIDVPPGAGTVPAIVAALPGDATGSYSNVGEGVEVSSEHPSMRDERRQRGVLILLTDGGPGCAAMEPGATVNRVHEAARRGHAVYVLGVGSFAGSDFTTLDQMAVASWQPCSSGCGQGRFYPGTSTAETQSSLERIVALVMSRAGACQVDVSSVPCNGSLCGNGQVCCGGTCNTTCPLLPLGPAADLGFGTPDDMATVD